MPTGPAFATSGQGRKAGALPTSRWTASWPPASAAWRTIEPNHVGTDEFMAFCTAVGCEPLICVNAGNGAPQEAADWVEYCNGGPGTEYGRLRAENGHPEPYNVRYWEIGNELYGAWQAGHCSPEEYAERYDAFRRAMLAVDPDLSLIYGNLPEATLVQSTTEGPAFSAGLEGIASGTGFPVLDALAALSRDGDRLILLAVNRHPEAAVEAAVGVTGFQPAQEAKVEFVVSRCVIGRRSPCRGCSAGPRPRSR